MWVEDPADKTQRALSTWFDAAENTYGNFSFSGDTLTWVDPDVSRGNTAAFYVCPSNATGANDLYVNTGAYDYETPSGCYDVDVSSSAAVQDTWRDILLTIVLDSFLRGINSQCLRTNHYDWHRYKKN